MYTSHFPCKLRFDLEAYYHRDDDKRDDTVLKVKFKKAIDPLWSDHMYPQVVMPYGQTFSSFVPFNTPASLASLAFGAAISKTES